MMGVRDINIALKACLTTVLGSGLISACSQNTAPDMVPIHIVGSSTIFPMSAKVAQELTLKTSYRALVESTGSGGGHKQFCQGAGANTPTITTSSRRRKISEEKLCQSNGVTQSLEIQLGLDGIALAVSVLDDRIDFDLSLSDIYRALAAYIPVSEQSCELMSNPYKTWNDIRPDLPNIPIKFYGPPPTSGTRDAFTETAMINGANLKNCDFNKSDIAAIREDGIWIDSGENDEQLVQILEKDPLAIGVIGFGSLAKNTTHIRPLAIQGAFPTVETIQGGDYVLTRPLYLYAKREHMASHPALGAYLMEYLGPQSWAPKGYLAEYGLIIPALKPRQDARNTLALFIDEAL